MKYRDINEIIRADGLRIVLLQGFPSPWGQAAKAMMEFKGLDYLAAPQVPGGENRELVEWAGVNSGPVLAWNDEKPIDRWDEILVLLERLAPDKALVPDDPALRVQLFGISHEICGPLGVGWNARLVVFRPIMESGAAPEAIATMAAKWGYRESDVEKAEARLIASLHLLADVLKSQRSRGSAYFVGDSLTAADFYWTAFSALVKPMAPEIVHLIPDAQALFDNIPPAVDAAIDPILLEHRDRTMQAHFAVPMEM